MPIGTERLAQISPKEVASFKKLKKSATIVIFRKRSSFRVFGRPN